MKSIPRRQRCAATGRRAAKLNRQQAARAWQRLANELDAMWEKEMPKFEDLLYAIQRSTYAGSGRATIGMNRRAMFRVEQSKSDL